MEKKYQIFISSTYEDLKEERKKVQDAILSIYQFPIGMEMFSAADEDQWEIIRETIDSSDYYILIIAHRYGSVIKEGKYAGISYTQKEFRYALEQKIPVLAFLIDESVPVIPKKMERIDSKRIKLNAFKTEVRTGRMVQFWTNKDDLANQVTNALNKQIGRKDRPGWIRISDLGMDDIQRKKVELNKVVEELDDNKEELQKKIGKLNTELKELVAIKRKVKVTILLRIGGIAIFSVLLLFGGLFLVDYSREKLQNNEAAETNDNYIQSAETNDNYIQSAETNDNYIQSDEYIELGQTNTQEDKDKGETKFLEKNDKIIDWKWKYVGNADNMRRILISTPSELGIDVSAYQKTIDWEKVRADGIDFAIIRVGYRGYEKGEIHLDSKFKENIDGAIANGIKIGVYFFSQATNRDEIDKEVDKILEALEGYSLDYPVGIELICKENYRTYELSTIEHQEEYIDLIKYFSTRIKQSGYTPMIYAPMEWFQQFPPDTFKTDYKWIYSSDSTLNEIDNCIIWQYTNDGEGVDGIGDGIKVSFNLSAFHGEND